MKAVVARVGMFPVALLALACAAPKPKTEVAAAECALSAQDSAFASDFPLYTRCTVQTPARPLDTQPVELIAMSMQPRVQCFKADIQFVVGFNGKPEKGTARIITTNDDVYAQAVLASLPGWMYEPGRVSGLAVRQLVRVHKTTPIRIAVEKRVVNASAPGGSSTVKLEPKNCQ